MGKNSEDSRPVVIPQSEIRESLQESHDALPTEAVGFLVGFSAGAVCPCRKPSFLAIYHVEAIGQANILTPNPTRSVPVLWKHAHLTLRIHVILKLEVRRGCKVHSYLSLEKVAFQFRRGQQPSQRILYRASWHVRKQSETGCKHSTGSVGVEFKRLHKCFLVLLEKHVKF